MVDVGQLLDRAVLRPRDRLRAVEDQGGMGATLVHHPLREGAVADLLAFRRVGVAVEPQAPAPAEEAFVPFDQVGERRPGPAV
jgi:hypothetical protein